MAMRLAAWALCAMLMAAAACAFETSGGPVPTIITLGGKPTDVDVTWAQSGGVVILKIVTRKPVPPEERDRLLASARQRLGGRPGLRAGYSQFGQLMLGFRLTGWTRPFGVEDLTIGQAAPAP
jgi:hypothetical protein